MNRTKVMQWTKIGLIVLILGAIVGLTCFFVFMHTGKARTPTTHDMSDTALNSTYITPPELIYYGRSGTGYVSVHNGDNVTAEFEVLVMVPDSTREGYTAVTNEQCANWFKVSNSTVTVPPKEIRRIQVDWNIVGECSSKIECWIGVYGKAEGFIQSGAAARFKIDVE